MLEALQKEHFLSGNERWPVPEIGSVNAADRAVRRASHATQGGVVFLDSMEGGLSDRYRDTTGETTITAAMELALANHVWSPEEIVGLLN